MCGNNFTLYIHRATRFSIRGGVCVLTVQVVDGEISSDQCGQILLGPTQSQQVTIQSIGLIDPYESLRDSTFQTIPLTITNSPGNLSIKQLEGHFCVEDPTGLREMAFEAVLELNKDYLQPDQNAFLSHVKGLSGRINLDDRSYPGIFLFDEKWKREKRCHGILKLLLDSQIRSKTGNFFQMIREGKEIGQGVIIRET